MSEDYAYDAIIIGAGPAGIACAYTLAKNGKSTLVIERGNTPGSKNMTGGRLYTYALDMVDEGLTAEAVLERKVTHEQIIILDGNRSISIDYHDPSFNSEGKSPQSYTILRAVFDEWFANKAVELGATVACCIKVDGLIEKNGQVIGVVAGEDNIYAGIVIAADGVNSLIAQKAGLIPDIKPHTLGVGVKEVILLPSGTIESRFNLKKDEGASCLMLGCTEGIHGGGFLYTNRESISLGCVFVVDELARHGRQVHDIFQELKMHPTIYPLIEGGETVEYGAHLVSEAGYREFPKKPYKDGLLVIGDSAGFVISTGYSLRGIDLAMVSGIAAARAVIAEKDPVRVGPVYMNELEKSLVMPTMKAVDGYYDILEIPRIYSSYPKLAAGLFQKLFTVDGKVPRSMKKEIMGLIKQNGLSTWQLIKDGVRGVKSI
jgi:electron transfer flavoprotein-quinone oxidoreductase